MVKKNIIKFFSFYLKKKKKKKKPRGFKFIFNPTKSFEVIMAYIAVKGISKVHFNHCFI